MINAKTFGPRIIIRFLTAKFNFVPTTKLFSLFKRSKGNGIEPNPLPFVIYAGTANGLPMLLTQLRCRFNKNYRFLKLIKPRHFKSPELGHDKVNSFTLYSKVVDRQACLFSDMIRND